MRQAPPLPFLPPQWHGKEILALAVCYHGDLAEGERVAKPLREFGHPIADIISPMLYTAWQTVLDPLLTPGARNYWKSHDFTALGDGLVDVLVDHARRIPDPQTEIALAQLGGAVARVPRGATAYNHRDGKVRDERAWPLVRSRQGRGLHRLGAQLVEGHRAVRNRQRVRELPDAGRR
ncbi:hypothetical protein QTI17_31545 [Variovorax sp. J31P179]|uniref:hypothetical protein n=1 Tax=Variovorax sp. J31P179 TaxID=3053508 RepID=UPI0025790615|nr:hypothetical protein [Variovorax sp. J31P179]MDM0085130.1 hypothetical protein [Variovorax sp. J31P179]